MAGSQAGSTADQRSGTEVRFGRRLQGDYVGRLSFLRLIAVDDAPLRESRLGDQVGRG